MEISGKGFLHFYQQASSLIGNQTIHRTHMFLPYCSNSCFESDYECIYIVINGKIRSVPLNILSSVYFSNSLFLANPQAMTLYGGRMTAARLKEVGSVTKEAIEKLHK